MNTKDIIGNNIKCLREFFGETQSELAEAVHVTGYTTISNYETGYREPNLDIVASIAQHYLVTPELIINEDLSSISRINNKDVSSIVAKNIDLLIPIINLPIGVSDTRFSCITKKHKEAYTLIKNGSTEEGMSLVFDCMVEYIDLYDKTERIEALANFTGLVIFFVGGCRNLSYMINNNTAAVKILDTPDKELDELGEPIFQGNDYNDFLSGLKEAFSELMNSNYNDLAYYYSSLRYAWGFFKEGLELPKSIALAQTMLEEMALLGNKYAKNYCKVFMRKCD